MGELTGTNDLLEILEDGCDLRSFLRTPIPAPFSDGPHFLSDLWGIKPTWSLWSFSARDHGDDMTIRGTMEGLLSGSELEQKRMIIN